MGSYAFILFPGIVVFLQLEHPISKGQKPQNKENPIDATGKPPILQEPKKIEGREEIIYE
jgi:hypothetical protein